MGDIRQAAKILSAAAAVAENEAGLAIDAEEQANRARRLQESMKFGFRTFSGVPGEPGYAPFAGGFGG